MRTDEGFEITKEEKFEITEHSTPTGMYHSFVPCRLFVVKFENEERRYLVVSSGRIITITKELKDIGFWRGTIAAYDCLSNLLYNGEIITRTSVVKADEKDCIFEKWVRKNMRP